MIVNREEAPHKIPLISLIDLVFILNLFFLITVSLSIGNKDVFGLKYIQTPHERGQTKANILIQVIKNNQGYQYFIIGPEQHAFISRANSIIQDKGIAPEDTIAIYREFCRQIRNYRNREVVRSELNKIFEKEKRETIKKNRRTFNVVIRSEFDVPYIKIVEIINLLQSFENIYPVNIKYIIRIGGIVRRMYSEALLDEVIFADPPPPPPEVPWLQTPNKMQRP